jgi:hypothetical protein
MTQLAAEFELSDVGLRKICKAAKVPTPGLGYWAKLANGKKVAKTELPTLYPFRSQFVHIGGALAVVMVITMSRIKQTKS